MKLLHSSMNRVVKSSQVQGDGEPVSIDNTVHVPLSTADPADESEESFAERRRRESYAFDERVRAFERQKLESNQQRAALEQELAQKQENLAADAEAAKEQVLAEARTSAGEIISKAQRDGVELKAAARNSGFTEGFTEGRSEAVEKCDRYVKAAPRFLSEINDKKDAYYASHEDELIETLLVMVKKLIRTEVSADKDTIFRIAKEAAKSFRNSDYIKLTFAEGDVSEEIVSDKKFLRSLVGEISDIEVEILEDAETGTVMLDNGKEIIDASIPTQLDFLKEIMKGS